VKEAHKGILKEDYERKVTQEEKPFLIVAINREKVKRSRKAIKEIQQTGKNSERLLK
jgi:hypothetical protein